MRLLVVLLVLVLLLLVLLMAVLLVMLQCWQRRLGLVRQSP